MDHRQFEDSYILHLLDGYEKTVIIFQRDEIMLARERDKFAMAITAYMYGKVQRGRREE